MSGLRAKPFPRVTPLCLYGELRSTVPKLRLLRTSTQKLNPRAQHQNPNPQITINEQSEKKE